MVADGGEKAARASSNQEVTYIRRNDINWTQWCLICVFLVGTQLDESTGYESPAEELCVKSGRTIMLPMCVFCLLSSTVPAVLRDPPFHLPALNYSRQDRVYKRGVRKPEAPSSNNYDHQNRRHCSWSSVCLCVWGRGGENEGVCVGVIRWLQDCLSLDWSRVQQC